MSELARRIGVHRNTVMRAEKGEHDLAAQTLAAWARECAVSADDLLGLDDEHGGHDDGAVNAERARSAEASR